MNSHAQQGAFNCNLFFHLFGARPSCSPECRIPGQWRNNETAHTIPEGIATHMVNNLIRGDNLALKALMVSDSGTRPSCCSQYTHGLRPSCCSQYTHGLRPSCESQAFAAACLGRPPPRSFPLSMGCWESPLQQVGSRPSCCPQYTHGLPSQLLISIHPWTSSQLWFSIHPWTSSQLWFSIHPWTSSQL